MMKASHWKPPSSPSAAAPLQRSFPSLPLLRPEQAAVDLSRVIATGRFSFDKAAKIPGWLMVRCSGRWVGWRAGGRAVSAFEGTAGQGES